MNLNMNLYRSGSGCQSYYADDYYSQNSANLNLVLEKLNTYVQQNTHDFFAQGIDTIRPPDRSLPSSGHATPVRQPSAILHRKPLHPEPPPHLAASKPLHIRPTPPLAAPVSSAEAAADRKIPSTSLTNFAMGLVETSVDLGLFLWNVVNQNIYFLNKLGNLGTLILLIFFLALTALYVSHESDTPTALIRKPFIHPPNATHVLLPDGRHLAYQEQGIQAEKARFSIIAPNTFLSSSVTGKLGLEISLMQEFGVRLITYDLPGFGKSDPHPKKNLKSAADDILHLSYTMGVTEKFWVVGYSSGAQHAWAALKYIPDKLAGAFMVSSMTNPSEPDTAAGKRRRTYNTWTAKRKFLYFLSRRFPRFVPYVYRKSFVSSNVGQRVRWLSLSLGKGDRAFIEEEMFQKFWQRDVEESVYQITANSFVEEAVL